ncbi:MAG: hypothetical protein AAGC54_16895, partial [Cyanobacteria bacterium P01_F01_bin.4]
LKTTTSDYPQLCPLTEIKRELKQIHNASHKRLCAFFANLRAFLLTHSTQFVSEWLAFFERYKPHLV